MGIRGGSHLNVLASYIQCEPFWSNILSDAYLYFMLKKKNHKSWNNYWFDQLDTCIKIKYNVLTCTDIQVITVFWFCTPQKIPNPKWNDGKACSVPTSTNAIKVTCILCREHVFHLVTNALSPGYIGKQFYQELGFQLNIPLDADWIVMK